MTERIYGTETEYGCLIESDAFAADVTPETLAMVVRDHLFGARKAGLLDVHYRDWGEPPGNGGFLFNGGRLYLDMGHVEYATPECASIRDLIAYERAGDALLLAALDDMRLREEISFIKNNIDHVTGATFGYHENYLMRRDISFYKVVVPTLLPFLVTRQIFAGSGRVGYHEEEIIERENARRPFRRYQTRVTDLVPYQISQRADHIVTEAYQWIQFSRAIVNTRDEPLADPHRFRRLHLLIGDANMSDYAAALRVGTTALVLTLLEEGIRVPSLSLRDHIHALRSISRDTTYRWLVELNDDRTLSAVEIQGVYFALADRHLRGMSHEVDWILSQWELVLDALANDPMRLKDRLDWVAKKWLLDLFIQEEGLSWDDPWLQSIDLEYHKIDPEKGLYYDLVRQGMMKSLLSERAVQEATTQPPPDTRAKGRSVAMRRLAQANALCVIDWDSIYLENGEMIALSNPLETYENTAEALGHTLARRTRKSSTKKPSE